MPAAPTARQLLLACATASFAVVFLAFVLYEQPGLGLAHFFYLCVALIAMTTGPRLGAAAGVAATALYVTGILANNEIPSTDVLTVSTAIRFVTFVSIGALIGLFASRNRSMLDELGSSPSATSSRACPTRAFEAAITKRLEAGRPFGLLLADMDALKELNQEAGPSAGNEALRQVADRLSRSLAPKTRSPGSAATSSQSWPRRPRSTKRPS